MLLLDGVRQVGADRGTVSPPLNLMLGIGIERDHVLVFRRRTGRRRILKPNTRGVETAGRSRSRGSGAVAGPGSDSGPGNDSGPGVNRARCSLGLCRYAASTSTGVAVMPDCTSTLRGFAFSLTGMVTESTPLS